MFEDFLYKKIRNDVVFSGFILVSFLTIIAALYGNSLIPVKVFIIRFFISGIVGVGLWYAGGWSAGDAKLFWLLSLFLPIDSSSIAGIFNETFIFLINIFVPVIPFLLISLIFDSIKREKISEVNIKDSLSSLIKSISIAIVMMLVSRVIYLNFFPYISQSKFNLISMLLIFFLMSYISKVFSNRKLYILGGILFLINIMMLYIQYKSKMFEQIYSIGILAIIIILFRIFYDVVLKYLDVEVVRLDKLKIGDSLSKEFVKNNGIDNDEIKERLGDIFMDGLTREQLFVLSDYLSKKNIIYVERQRTFSFSAYIVFGYSFTYLKDFDNIILFLRRLFGS